VLQVIPLGEHKFFCVTYSLLVFAKEVNTWLQEVDLRIKNKAWINVGVCSDLWIRLVHLV